jgi:hypothetical protein
MAPATASTLVLGTAIGYSEEQMAVFVRSLRATGYAGELALLVDRRDLARLRQSALLRGTQLIGVASWLPFQFRALLKGDAERWLWRPLHATLWACVRALGYMPLPQRWRWRLQIPLGSLLYPPSESRFLHYYRLVGATPCQRVLLSDVRDVLFQTDPFAKLPHHGLAISLEVPDYTIGSEQWNRSRTLLIYGEPVLQKVADCQVSCSGVTAGDAGSMRRYLELMAQDIFALGRLESRQGWFDQAIHNVVLRTRWREPLHGLDTLRSPVATLGAVRDADLRFDDRGRLLNLDGSPVCIVHQYDRKPAARDVLLRSLASA